MSDDTELLMERLAALELALEDTEWLRMGDDGHEFSADARRRIVDLARLMALKNPIIKRGVNVQVQYVWGQGVSIRAAQPEIDAVIQAFLDDEKNQDELTSHQAREQKERELQTDGNIFFVLFPNRITGAVRVRSIPVGEVSAIITNPDDSKDPWYYKREWTEETLNTAGATETTTRAAYYPDWRYTPRTRPPTIGSASVLWDTPVYHVKVGAYSDWRFGCSEVYAAIDWARAYKEFLEDWATFTRALSRYAWKLATKGGARGVQAAKARIGSTLGAAVETNPPATTGATFIGAEGVEMNPMRIGGANVGMDDGRRMLLMVAAAQGLPETFYGDVSVGTLATATSLDRPTELTMRSRQTLWSDIHQSIFAYVLRWAVKAPKGALRSMGRIERVNDGAEIDERVIWNADVQSGVTIQFPPIIAPNRAADVQAVDTAAPYMDKKTALQLMLNALGLENFDVEAIWKAMQEEKAQAAAQQRAIFGQQPQDTTPEGDVPPKD